MKSVAISAGSNANVFDVLVYIFVQSFWFKMAGRDRPVLRSANGRCLWEIFSPCLSLWFFGPFDVFDVHNNGFGVCSSHINLVGCDTIRNFGLCDCLSLRHRFEHEFGIVSLDHDCRLLGVLGPANAIG